MIGMTMREKIARAICLSCGDNPDSILSINWTNYLSHADAVLTAMHEPTPEMVRFSTLPPKMAFSNWRIMIDAAKE
jgi:hypothetical protein